MDYFGALALGGALTLLTIALSQRSTFLGESIIPYFMAALGVLLIVVLIVVERRAIQPLLASFLYNSRAFLSSNLTQFLVGVSLIIALVTVPLMAGTVMEKKAWESALQLVRVTAAISVGAVVGGYILRWTLAMAGLGFGLVISPIGVSALSAAAQSLLGRRGLLGHLIPNGRDGVGPGGPVGVGYRALLQPDRPRDNWFDIRADRGPIDRSWGDRVPEPIYDCGIPVPACHSAGSADENGRGRRSEGTGSSRIVSGSVGR